MRRAVRRAATLLVSLMSMTAPAAAADIGGASLVPVAFADLPGWADDDHAAAFAAFRTSCAALLAQDPALRSGRPAEPDLLAVCAAASGSTPAAARSFFESRFAPFEVRPPSGAGFLTSYYEPEFPGARQPGNGFVVPLLDRPDDLVTISQGGSLPDIEAGLQAARRRPDGGYEPYPDRAAIEDGALGARARPIVYLREPGEAFIIQVQGSARIRLPDGGLVRLAYAGRNGHPYTSIGRLLAERGLLPLETMTLAGLMGWLKDNPAAAKALMRENRSYIFFRETELADTDGPIGAAGVPLTAYRSLAVDRTLHTFHTPVFVEAPELIDPEHEGRAFRRLMIAQDTGSAIVGPARGDLFFGAGQAVGSRAGRVRHVATMIALVPVESAPRE